MKYFAVVLFSIMFFACSETGPGQEDSSKLTVESILKNVKAPEFSEFSVTPELGEDSLFDCRMAINDAISECAENGGGRVIIPPGYHFCCGPVNLKSNVDLHLEEGAVLAFSQDPKHYLPVVFVRWEGTEAYNYSPFIYARDQKNIAISGKGVIDGNGQAEDSFREWRPRQKKDQQKLREMGREGVPVEERVFGEGHFLRPQLIHLINCENILFEDFKIINSSFWIMQPTYCNNITIRRVRVESFFINNDGVDLDSDTNVLIEDCYFNTGDDFVAIKSGRDQDAWRVNKPCKNIVIRNCKSDKSLHGISFGSEMSGGVENVIVENVRFGKNRQYSLQFKSNKDRGGYIKNIIIRDIEIDSTRDVVYFTNQYHSYEGGNSPALFENISIEDVNCNTASNAAINMVGLPEMPISNVVIKNLTVKEAGKPNSISDVKNLSVLNVQVNQ